MVMNNTMAESGRKNHDSFDLTKLILSFLVVTLHLTAFQKEATWLIAFSRIAVPMFFLISSYLFFEPLAAKPNDSDWRKERLRHFVLRGVTLYFSWFLLQMPLTLRIWGWQAYGYSEGYGITRILLAFLKKLFLGNTFVASWYLSSLILGMCTVVFLDCFMSDMGLLALGAAAYLLCCLNSGYAELNILRISFFYIPNSFPASLLWLALGKQTAENTGIVEKLQTFGKKMKIGLTCMAAVLYAVEYYVCSKLQLSGVTDAHVMLVPLCFFLFLLVLEDERDIPHAREMRTISTVIYCSHGSLAALTLLLGERIGVSFEQMPEAVFCYLIVLLAGTGFALLLMQLQKNRRLKWLRYLW